MTDANGFNSFFHVLIFYEEVNEAEIQKGDFDIVFKIWQKQQSKQSKRLNTLKKQTSEENKVIDDSVMFKREVDSKTRRATRLKERRPIKTVEQLQVERIEELPEEEDEKSKLTGKNYELN